MFRFALAVALLGLGRHALVSVVELWQARRRAGDGSLSLVGVLGGALARLNPLRYLVRHRWLYSLASMAFHVGVIAVPIFYLGHVRLWQRGLGLGWPALPGPVADGLTLLSLAAAALLLVLRATSAASRALGRLQDWALPLLIAAELLSGYWLAHPASSPLTLDTLLLTHVWGGDLLLIATPFTKIAHCALLPLSQPALELAWRFVPGAGRDVVRTLGKEGQPI